MSRDATHKQAQQKWLPGFEPSLDDVNKELATLRPEYDFEGLVLLRPCDADKASTVASGQFKKEAYLQGDFFVGLLATGHPETCNIVQEKSRIATLHKLTMADPLQVLSQLANAKVDRSNAVIAAIPALATIGFQNSPDEATWRAFNDKLRYFMDAVCPTTSDHLSNQDYKRLLAQGFKIPKTANDLAKAIRSYLSRVDDGSINPFGT